VTASLILGLIEPYAIGMAGRKRSCFSESRHAIHTPLHRFVCRRKKECYGEHRAPRPPQTWMYGVQGPTIVYSRTVSQRQHRLALHGLRQDTAAHTGEVSPALWAGSNRGASLTAWTRAVDEGFTEWLYGLCGLCRRWSPRHAAKRNISRLIRS
jgi:hypothetical protein